MEILKNNNTQLKNIVESRAKYQKVMLIYDTDTSENEILNIYEQLKGTCIFNKMQIGTNASEIYNGYKLLIFYLSANSFIKFDYDIEEFTSVFIAKDENILPFFLNSDFRLSESERYLLTSSSLSDINAISSIYFNRFYNYMSDLLYFQFSNIHFNFEQKEITQFNTIQALQDMDNTIQFADIKLAKEMDIPYQDLMMIDFLLVTAFLGVINAVGNRTLELVDTYKAVKENLELVDKFYAMQTNQALVRSVELNFNFLFTACNKTKEKIYSLLYPQNEEEILQLISKIKTYSLNSEELMGYLYLYNVFGY